jgi:hypothetical protein
VHGVELLCLMLGDLEHFHAQDAESVFFELLDDVSDPMFTDRVRFNDGKSPLQSLHSFSG